MVQQLVVDRPVARLGVRPGLLTLLVPLFFCSGVSALIYQVLWLRLLALVFGVTVLAATTVLASFMAGLALGSFAAGRLVDRARNPLRWFAAAEALIGLSALATPYALGAAEQLYGGLYRAFPEQLLLLTVARFAVSTAVLIVPATLMGATLPIVVRSAAARQGQLGERVGLLYGVNTAGAIAGTLLAGFYLVGASGIAASFQFAAGLNLLVAVGAAMGSGLLGTGEATSEPRAAATAPTTALTPAARHVVLAVFALSGFGSIAQEVIWTRLLVFFQEVSAYAFVVILTAFLTGIAGGSLVAAAFLRRRANWLLVLAGLEIAIGVVSVAAMAFLGLAPRLLISLQARLGPMPEVLPVAVAGFVALLPTTLLLGAAFPIGLRLWTEDGDPARMGRRIGLFYSLNVLGSIAGAVAAGFVLLPAFGSRTSLVLVAALAVAGGLALVAVQPGRRGLALGAAGLLLFGLAVATVRNPHDTILNFRYRGHEVLWREEGMQNTVSIHRLADGSLTMFLDGFNQATDTGTTTHRLVGSLPLLLHPQPRDVLVVGLGGGATAGAAAAYPGARLDLVELSGSVVRGADLFRHANGDVLRRPNVQLLVQDGRNHLLLAGRSYDAITADIIWPNHAGAGNLYSREYFRLARAALRDDGIMLQWLGALPRSQHQLVLRTFLEVFPETTLWGDVLLVGTTKPLDLSRGVLEAKLADPAVASLMAPLGVRTVDDLLGLYRAGPDELRRYAGPGPLLTDDRPQVEYFLTLPRDEPPAEVGAIRGAPLKLAS